MKDIEIKEPIVVRLTKRGKGVVGDPVRDITQVFEKNGDLIAEHDPCMTDGFIEVFKWLLGYYDFPEKKPNEAAYYWRTHLRYKLKNELGIEITDGLTNTETQQ